jgi:hypothetical protein
MEKPHPICPIAIKSNVPTAVPLGASVKAAGAAPLELYALNEFVALSQRIAYPFDETPTGDTRSLPDGLNKPVIAATAG